MKKTTLVAALFPALAASGAAQQQLSMQLSNQFMSPDFAYIEVPHSPELEPETVTIEAWITPQGIGQEFTNRIGTLIVGKVAQGVDPLGGSNVASWWLGWRPFDAQVTAGFSRQLAGPGAGAGDGVFISSNRAVLIGQRAHVAFTFDGHRVSMYVNGVQTFSFLTSIPGETITGYEQNPVVVGAANSCCNQSMRFDGIIDEVRVWNHARSGQEIRRHMYCRLAGTEAGLVGYWNFDGQTLDDRTPLGNDGTMVGSTWSYRTPAKVMQDCGAQPRLLHTPITIPGFVGPLFF